MTIQAFRRPHLSFGFKASNDYLNWLFVIFCFARWTMTAKVDHPAYEGRTGGCWKVPLTELIPGKLYTQCIDPRDRGQGRWRTVFCVKYETWRIYKKATLIVMGQPDRPVVEELVDKFHLVDWLSSFEEVPDES